MTGELDVAIKTLIRVVGEGLNHGFFEYKITGEIVKDGKRRLTIVAGKCIQFTIPVENLKELENW